MIVYFAGRKMNILGHASTNLPAGFVIVDDLKTEEVGTGIASFECTVGYRENNQLELEYMMQAGNYVLCSDGGVYTILESEKDTRDQTVYCYAEDAGLDLINEVVEAYTATEAHTAEWYINKFTFDSGFEIGTNEIPESSTRKLIWEGESTATARVASIATQFGNYEVSYSFKIDELQVTHKYINIHEKRGKNINEDLRLNRDINRIITKKSVSNLATALKCKGGTTGTNEQAVTLKGYAYDDGDFYVDGELLKSRSAHAKWSRYQWEKRTTGGDGHIVKQFSYDTTNQATLCARAITELKKVCDMEINFEVEIAKLPDNVGIGDRINIVDDAGQLYLSTRILILEYSETRQEYKATLGEHIIKKSGISQKVEELAAQFADKVIEIGGENLIRNSNTMIYEDYYFETAGPYVTHDGAGTVTAFVMTASHDGAGTVTLQKATASYNGNGTVTIGK